MLLDIESNPEERENISDQNPHIVKVVLLILVRFEKIINKRISGLAPHR